MHIIEEDMHWVPLAHDMDQNLEKLVNISFSSGTAPCRCMYFEADEVLLVNNLLVMHFITEVNGLECVIHYNSWALWFYNCFGFAFSGLHMHANYLTLTFLTIMSEVVLGIVFVSIN